MNRVWSSWVCLNPRFIITLMNLLNRFSLIIKSYLKGVGIMFDMWKLKEIRISTHGWFSCGKRVIFLLKHGWKLSNFQHNFYIKNSLNNKVQIWSRQGKLQSAQFLKESYTTQERRVLFSLYLWVFNLFIFIRILYKV